MLNIETRKLSPFEVDQFIDLLVLFDDVFELEPYERPGKDYLGRLLAKDDFMVFVALLDDKVVGGLTTFTIQQYITTLPLVYIYDLAVKTELQRQGIGKLLITSITDYCKKKGVEEVFVQADVADGYALDFYRSTGARGEDVVHFYYPLNDKNAPK